MYGIAPKLPVVIAPSQGFVNTLTLKENVQQNLKNLLLTSPGERIMDVEFGVGVRNFLFENFKDVNLESKIYEQVSTYMPFLDLIAVDVQPDPDHGVLSVEITYSISNVLSEETLTVSIDPNLTS